MAEPIELLTFDELATRLRVSRRTVERLVAAGRIRTIAVGRRRLVTSREFDAYIAWARRTVA